MNKLVNFMLAGLLGLVVLTAAGPILIRLVNALVPLVIVVGIVVAVLHLVFTYTRRW